MTRQTWFRSAVAALGALSIMLMFAAPANASTSTKTYYTTDPNPGGSATVTTTWGAGCGPISLDSTVYDLEDNDFYHASLWAYVHKCDGTYEWDWLTWDDTEDLYGRHANLVVTGTGAWIHVCLYYVWYAPNDLSGRAYCNS